MYKRDRVNDVLEELFQSDRERLSEITPEELSKDNRLFDISTRTIQNTLKSFQLANDLMIPDRRTKQIEVMRFLEKLEREFSKSDFVNLGYRGLKAYPELKGIGKTTVMVSLARFKEKRYPTYTCSGPES
jgi:hypothetical protein